MTAHVDTYVCPYLEPPTIPEGVSVSEYRINRPRPRKRPRIWLRVRIGVR